MACTEPGGPLTVPAFSTKVLSFYVPAGNGQVTFGWHLLQSIIGLNGSLAFTLRNALGSILASGGITSGDGSVIWSLGNDDPHTITLVNTLEIARSTLGEAVSLDWSLAGACTTSQGAVCVPTCGPGGFCYQSGGPTSMPVCAYPCSPNPCAAGQVCTPHAGGAGEPPYFTCADPTCPTCLAGSYCNAATGHKCTPCSPACASGGICGPGVNGCTCPSGSCCPPCPSGQTCTGTNHCSCLLPKQMINGVCQTPPTTGGPTPGGNQDVLVAAGGAAVILAAFLLVGRSRASGAAPASAPPPQVVTA